tara:strand:+ start:869 stop:1759 length:891 start_codon:yes stop_codon:yes gene_type:complete
MSKYSIPKHFQGLKLKNIPYLISYDFFCCLSTTETRKVIAAYYSNNVSDIEKFMRKTNGDPDKIADELINFNQNTLIEDIKRTAETLLERIVQVSQFVNELSLVSPISQEKIEQVIPPPDSELNYLLTEKVAELEKIVEQQKQKIENLETQLKVKFQKDSDLDDELVSIELEEQDKLKLNQHYMNVSLSLYKIVWNNIQNQNLLKDILTLINTEQLKKLFTYYENNIKHDKFVNQDLLTIFEMYDKRKAIHSLLDRYAHAGCELGSFLNILCQEKLFLNKTVSHAKNKMIALFQLI